MPVDASLGEVFVVLALSLAGVYMTRWILRWLPLWSDRPPEPAGA